MKRDSELRWAAGRWYSRTPTPSIPMAQRKAEIIECMEDPEGPSFYTRHGRHMCETALDELIKEGKLRRKRISAYRHIRRTRIELTYTPQPRQVPRVPEPYAKRKQAVKEFEQANDL